MLSAEPMAEAGDTFEADNTYRDLDYYQGVSGP